MKFLGGAGERWCLNGEVGEAAGRLVGRGVVVRFLLVINMLSYKQRDIYLARTIIARKVVRIQSAAACSPNDRAEGCGGGKFLSDTLARDQANI